MIKSLILIFLFFQFITIKSLSQFGGEKEQAIRLYSFHIDTSENIIDSADFVIDSISVHSKRFTHKKTAECIFAGSDTHLTMSYYLKNDQIVLIEVIEPSPLVENMHYESQYFYEGEKLTHQDFSRTAKFEGLERKNMDDFKVFGYSRTLKGDTLLAICHRLYQYLK